MKVTYLVFENGIGSALRVATKEEWNRIMQENRALPREQRRFFMQDCFEDCGDMDCMYIETTREEYDKWHSAYQVRYKKRVDAGEITVLSLDISTQTSDDSSMIDTLEDGVNWEERMIDAIRMKELRTHLAAWKTWANELLDYYLAGEKVAATRILSKKYGVSEKTIRQRKRALEEFVQNFFK